MHVYNIIYIIIIIYSLIIEHAYILIYKIIYILFCCLEGSSSHAPPPPPTEQGVTSSAEYPVLIPEETTTQEIVSTPNITPCKTTNYIINIFKHGELDSMALENTLSHQVEVYMWSLMPDGVLRKNIIAMTSVEFREQFEPNEYVFVGKTIQSKLTMTLRGLASVDMEFALIKMCCSMYVLIWPMILLFSLITIQTVHYCIKHNYYNIKIIDFYSYII